VTLPTTLENRNMVHGHELASGYAISQPHPGAAGSFQQRTQLHSGYGKRSAEADADAFYGAVATLENRNNLHGHEAHSQYAISQPHPGFAGSYQQVSRLHSGLHYGGYYGKRSAEPFYGGVAVHPGHAVSSTHRSAQGLSLVYGIGYGHGFYGYGKRSALPFNALVVGSPEWQAYKNAELAHIAPSTGPQVPGVVGNWAQSQLNWIASQQAVMAAGAGRKKRQATSWQENFVRPSQSWEANYHGQNNWQENFVRPSQSWEAAFVAGHGRRKRQTQAALDFVGPAPGPTAANFAQSALNFVAPAPGPSPVNFAQSSLDFVGPAPSNHAQAQLNFQQEALNFIARG